MPNDNTPEEGTEDPYADVPDPQVPEPDNPNAEPRSPNKSRIVSDDVVAETPPPASVGNKHKGVWKDKLAPCMSQPGATFRLRVWNDVRSADRTAANLRSGKMQLPDAQGGRFVFTTRSNYPEQGQSALWATYHPDPEVKPEPEPVTTNAAEPVNGAPAVNPEPPKLVPTGAPTNTGPTGTNPAAR